MGFPGTTAEERAAQIKALQNYKNFKGQQGYISSLRGLHKHGHETFIHIPQQLSLFSDVYC